MIAEKMVIFKIQIHTDNVPAIAARSGSDRLPLSLAACGTQTRTIGSDSEFWIPSRASVRRLSCLICKP